MTDASIHMYERTADLSLPIFAEQLPSKVVNAATSDRHPSRILLSFIEDKRNSLLMHMGADLAQAFGRKSQKVKRCIKLLVTC